MATHQASTRELLRETVADAKELVRSEVDLAKEEAKRDVLELEGAAIGVGVAASSALVGMTVLAMAMVLALGGTATVALLIACVFFVVCGVASFIAYTLVPKDPMHRTRMRTRRDLHRLEEHAL